MHLSTPKWLARNDFNFVQVLLCALFFLFLPPPQVRCVEVTHPKLTREMSQLIKTKGFGENISNLPISRNMHQFDFTSEDTLTDKMIVHLNVLGPGVEDRVLCKVDTAKVVTKDRRRIRQLYLQIP